MVRPSSSGCLSKLFFYFPFYMWCFVHTTYQYLVIELMGIITQGKNGQTLGHCDQLKVRWGDPKIVKINPRDVSLWQRQRSKRKMCTCITGHTEKGARVRMRIKILGTSGENPEVQGENWFGPFYCLLIRKWCAGSKIVLHDKMREIFAIDRRTNRNKRSVEGRDYKVL